MNRLFKLLWFCLFSLLLCSCAANDRNFNFWGLDAPKFEEWTISDHNQHIENDRQAYWQITYESTHNRTFNGKIRHISVNYEPAFPFLTHDILVTSGDFANPLLVDTSVSNHHFYWSAAKEPIGSINLLHVVVLDPDLYDQLMQLHADDWVSINGREILTIQLYQKGRHTSTWSDSGCNTLLIQSITVESP
jgi:hypothetical protein